MVLGAPILKHITVHFNLNWDDDTGAAVDGDALKSPTALLLQLNIH